MKCKNENFIWSLLRISMGIIFLWAFLDKLFGLGFATEAGKSWLAGGSPTFGFLKFATHGPLASIYQGMAGSVLVEWLFMLGLIFIGVTLTLGILVRLGSYVGVLMMALMYTAGFMPPEHHPFLDEHVIYALIMIGLSLGNSGECIGLGKQWSKIGLVRKYKILK